MNSVSNISTNYYVNRFGPGLTYNVVNGYMADNVAYFNDKTPLSTGRVTNISSISAGTNNYIPEDNTRESYSVQWLGYFMPNATGAWYFSTNSDDCSYLWIGTGDSSYTSANAVVRNGGEHGDIKITSSAVTLVKNVKYRMRVQFGENGGGDNMVVSFKLNLDGIERTDGTGFYYT